MKKFFTSMFFLFGAFCAYAQFQLENTTCIILIDGKLPRHISGFVEYNNEFNQKDTAIFYYFVGTIRFKTTDLEKFRSLPDTTSIIIHINFLEYRKNCSNIRHHYYRSFPLTGLLNDYYIVISITNFNIKKGTYYFDYEVSDGAYFFKTPRQEGYSKRCKIFHNTMPCLPKKSRR